jgi:outer membrane lipoprotein-sorting protein
MTLYADFTSGLPATVHLRAGTVADLTLRVSQLEINTTIDSKAFEIQVPGDALPLSVEELRRAGPLGERAGG